MSLAVVQAAGDYHALGVAQGEAFADGIHRALDFYTRLDRADVDGMRGGVTRTAPYLEAAGQALPEIVAEIEGLAEGAGISLEDAFFLNCIEEVLGRESCTTMTHGPYLLHAEQWYAGHSDVGVVVGHPDEGPSFLSPVCAGTLPAVGMSSAGVAQGIDSLTGTDDRIGVPRVLVSRLALRAASVDEGIRLATIERRAGGYAHTLASTERSVVLETSATLAHVLEDTPAHTNHYLAPELGSVARSPSAGSQARLNSAEQLLRARPPASLKDCARLLADHVGEPQGICVHETGLGGESTVFAMACDVRTGAMIVCDGSPCEGRWEELQVPGFQSPRMQRVG